MRIRESLRAALSLAALHAFCSRLPKLEKAHWNANAETRYAESQLLQGAGIFETFSSPVR